METRFFSTLDEEIQDEHSSLEDAVNSCSSMGWEVNHSYNECINWITTISDEVLGMKAIGSYQWNKELSNYPILIWFFPETGKTEIRTYEKEYGE